MATMSQLNCHDTKKFLENATYILSRMTGCIQIHYSITHLSQTLMTVTIVHYDPFLWAEFLMPFTEIPCIVPRPSTW